MNQRLQRVLDADWHAAVGVETSGPLGPLLLPQAPSSPLSRTAEIIDHEYRVMTYPLLKARR